MATPRLVLTAGQRADIARQTLDRFGLNSAPVVDGAGRFMGITDLGALGEVNDRHRMVGELVDPAPPVVTVSSMLDVALESLTEASLSWVPVLDDDRQIVGTLSVSDIARAYRQELVASADAENELNATAGASQVTITADSPLIGLTLRSANLPRGILITSVSRADYDFAPGGDTVLVVGDRLSILGRAHDPGYLGARVRRRT